MALFRSEEVTLAQLFLQSDSAYSCIRELGEIGKVEFRDLNPDVSAFQRKFVNEVRRCDEMDRKLSFLCFELEKAGLKPRPAGNIEACDPQELIDLESKFEVLETEVKEINGNKETLKRNLLDLIELRQILLKTQHFFEEAEQYSTVKARRGARSRGVEKPYSSDNEGKGLLDEADQNVTAASQTKFMFVAGVVAQEKLAPFERVLWRACRGNVFVRQAPILQPLEDPTTGALVYKVVFVLFFQGDALRTRVRKICEGFRATLYQCPETASERQEMATAVANRIADLTSVLHTTEDHSFTQLEEIAQEIDVWQQKVTKVKAIYDTMNMFNLDMAQHCLVAECWCPVSDLDDIQTALIRGTQRSGSTVPSILNRMHSDESPPTFFRTNKVTKGFMNIVEAYGVASYREVNPALYTIITFPFLFAVMFGDTGHGMLMALFGLALIIFERRIEQAGGGGEMFGTFFNGRYIIFLMGVFSIYTGFMYNDIFSKSINVFGSNWNVSFTSYNFSNNASVPKYCCSTDDVCVINIEESETTIVPTEAQLFQMPYPIGLDPIWQVAQNKLLFTNSYKMKMSIVVGVLHMLFGVVLSVFNHVHFKNYLNILMDFVPQMLFMSCIFGWLVFLIIVKWMIFYEDQATAPSLLITLINMFLQFASSPKVNETGPVDDNLYSTFAPTASAANAQNLFQVFLVITAVASIPWMLFSKPLYIYIKHKKNEKQGYQRHVETGSDEIMNHDDSDKLKKGEESENEEQFQMSEVVVTQAIHTIEYCLGAISNTASYLRLWALSLAHAELSEVLWDMVFRMGLAFGAASIPFGVVTLVALFAFWAVLTIGILLVMEGLSAFLHALRLHWVEFQSKFYEGAGNKFSPFSFKAILAGETKD